VLLWRRFYDGSEATHYLEWDGLLVVHVRNEILRLELNMDSRLANTT